MKSFIIIVLYVVLYNVRGLLGNKSVCLKKIHCHSPRYRALVKGANIRRSDGTLLPRLVYILNKAMSVTFFSHPVRYLVSILTEGVLPSYSYCRNGLRENGQISSSLA